MKCYTEEIFGPVLITLNVDSLDEVRQQILSYLNIINCFDGRGVLFPVIKYRIKLFLIKFRICFIISLINRLLKLLMIILMVMELLYSQTQVLQLANSKTKLMLDRYSYMYM